MFEEGTHETLMENNKLYFILQARNVLSRRGSFDIKCRDSKQLLSVYKMLKRHSMATNVLHAASHIDE